ncbi:MAG: GNAT family N-acetyltransferase [Gaiellaceae bacterium]
MSPRVILPSEQPALTDGVVTLTPFTLDDAPIMVQWDHDSEMAKWFDWPLVPPAPHDLQHAQQVVERWRREYVLGERIPWAVRNSATTELLGSVELRPRSDGGADASYATHEPYRGTGYASRALRLVCRWAFEVARFNRIIAEYDARNIASSRVAMAAGFVEVGRGIGESTYEANRTAPGDLVTAVLQPAGQLPIRSDDT